VYDEREGKGIQTFPNNSVYEGEWKNNMLNGRGKIVYDDGDSF
jgi:hypothetical protein